MTDTIPPIRPFRPGPEHDQDGARDPRPRAGVLISLQRWRARRRKQQEAAAEQARQAAAETAARLEALHEEAWRDWADLVQQARAQARTGRALPDERTPA